MNLDDVKTFSLAALQYAVDGESEPVATIVQAIAENADTRGLYAMCCTWAGSGEAALEAMGVRSRGEVWTPGDLHAGDLPDSPARLFALRFVAAYCNDDSATTESLFAAAARAGGTDFGGSAMSLLGVAAALNREAMGAAS